MEKPPCPCSHHLTAASRHHATSPGLTRFTVDEYHQMIQAGIIGEDDNVELLEGWIVPKMGRNPPHDTMISIVEAVLPPLLPKGLFCRGQSAITTTSSEPEPDIAVIRGTQRNSWGRHPGPADMAQVIEVADSSLSRDRTIKGPIYAAAAVPVYWIINLVDSQIEVYTNPTGPDPAPVYRTHGFIESATWSHSSSSVATSARSPRRSCSLDPGWIDRVNLSALGSGRVARTDVSASRDLRR